MSNKAATGDKVCSRCGAWKSNCGCVEYLTIAAPLPDAFPLKHPLLNTSFPEMQQEINELAIQEANPPLSNYDKALLKQMTDKGIWYEFIMKTENKMLKDLGIEGENNIIKSRVTINLIDVLDYWEAEDAEGDGITVIEMLHSDINILYPYDAFANLMLKKRGIIASKPPKPEEA